MSLTLSCLVSWLCCHLHYPVVSNHCMSVSSCRGHHLLLWLMLPQTLCCLNGKSWPVDQFVHWGCLCHPLNVQQLCVMSLLSHAASQWLQRKPIGWQSRLHLMRMTWKVGEAAAFLWSCWSCCLWKRRRMFPSGRWHWLKSLLASRRKKYILCYSWLYSFPYSCVMLRTEQLWSVGSTGPSWTKFIFLRSFPVA